MTPNSNWLSPEEWKWVQDTMPIACCDVVPVRLGGSGTIEQIGLIYRSTPHQGMRWCMVGGRMWRNESIAEAITRQLRETLGSAVRFEIDANRQPDFVVQYFTTRRSTGFLDTRQHAITLAFVVPIEGDPTAMGEAEAFKWFDRAGLPPADQFGFEQDRVIDACLKSWSHADYREAHPVREHIDSPSE